MDAGIPAYFQRITTSNAQTDPSGSSGPNTPTSSSDSSSDDALTRVLSTVSKLEPQGMNADNAQGAGPEANSADGTVPDSGWMLHGNARQAIKNFGDKDPTDYREFSQAIENKDGHTALNALIHGVETGEVSKDDAIAIAKPLQSAMAGAGRIIDGDHTSAFNKAVGDTVLT